jgi:hypothetical protein
MSSFSTVERQRFEHQLHKVWVEPFELILGQQSWVRTTTWTQVTTMIIMYVSDMAKHVQKLSHLYGLSTTIVITKIINKSTFWEKTDAAIQTIERA